MRGAHVVELRGGVARDLGVDGAGRRGRDWPGPPKEGTPERSSSPALATRASAAQALDGAELFLEAIVEGVGDGGEVSHRLLDLRRVQPVGGALAHRDDPVADEAEGRVGQPAGVELEEVPEERAVLAPCRPGRVTTGEATRR